MQAATADVVVLRGMGTAALAARLGAADHAATPTAACAAARLLAAVLYMYTCFNDTQPRCRAFLLTRVAH